MPLCWSLLLAAIGLMRRIGAIGMANGGWLGTAEEWSRIESPLRELDPEINDFAERFRLAVGKNSKDWPERSPRWGEGINCLIQIYLAELDKATWNIWLCCFEDREGERYWRKKFLVERKRTSAFKDQLSELLAEGRARLMEWSEHPETLELAATPGPPATKRP